MSSNTSHNWSTHAERTVYLSQDTAAPTFATATVNGSTLVVTFNEDLGTAASLANGAFTVKKGSSGTTQTLSGTPSISGSTVTLTLATAVTATDTAVKVAYAKPTSGSANKLIDKFGNDTATFPDQVVTNNTPAAGDVWTATLTPADLSSGILGCDNSNITTAEACSTSSVLSDDDFPYDSTNYHVTALSLINSSGSLTLSLDTDITTATDGLTLVVGSAPFTLASADDSTDASVRIWNATGLTWTAGTAVAVKLIEPPSTDATLSALTVSPKAITGFASDRTSYEIGVASTVTQATIVPTTNDSSATVGYSTTDADGTTSGHQVNLSAGRNAVTVTVTAEDTITTQTYTLSINRGVDTDFGWKASDDFDGLIAAENNNPRGLWSDGTTMWVADAINDKLYAYDLATKAREVGKDFDSLSAAGNSLPFGIWSDNITMWVADYGDSKLYAYNMATKARDAGKDITTVARPTGIWSDGTTIWVAHQTPAKIHAYNLDTKASDADKGSDTLRAAGNGDPGGIWSNNITMWVTDEDNGKIYAYNMATKAHDAGKDFDTLSAAGNETSRGIWANTDTMWSVDSEDDRIYSYNMPAIAANTPAAGAPAITAPNVFRVPAVLGVDLSGITDTDGTVTIATNATYKWQRFNAAGTTLETDNIGTDATYTLTDTDATKTLKVVVNFTDDASNSEGPLASAATSAITAAATCAAPTYVGGATQLGPARKVAVEQFTSGLIFFGFSASDGAGSLDKTTFTTAAPNDYEILGVATGNNQFIISLDKLLTPAEKSTLVLHICDQAYAFAPVTNPTLTPANYIFNTPQSWSTHAERTVYLSEDTAAPTFATATVNGSTLVVTLSEDLGAAGTLVNSAFTVKKGSSGTTQTLSGTPSISGSTVTLTLATAVTATDTAVKVAYAKPTSGSANKLIDKFGNETVTFPDQAVTNNTTVNNPPTVANPIPNQMATVGTEFSYQFPATTFNDVDATDTLTYSAKKADDSALPPWLTFTDTTRTFSGTPTAAETFSVKVTASDGATTVSDEFDIKVSAAASTDATLSALTVSPKDIIGFTNDRRDSYEVGVASTVTQATIVATTSDSAATVEYSTTDTDDTASDHQVNLSAGGNEVKVTVTAEDMTTTETYTISINQGVTSTFGWKASDDFDGLITAENNFPTGIWSNGITMWVADVEDDQLYAYDLATKARDASKDFDTLNADNGAPYGIWSNGITMWVADPSDSKLYAYNMATKAHDAGNDLDTVAGSTGIWSDSTTMWVANQPDKKIYAYTLATGVRDVTKDFNTLNTVPAEIWSNGITMWVSNEGGGKIYAYNMASKAQDVSRDNTLLGDDRNEDVFGVWANTDTMWATDSDYDKIYSYNMPTNTPASGVPTITGTAQVDQTLTADVSGIEDMNGLPSELTYQWKRVDSDGVSNPTNIGADAATYTLTNIEVDKKVLVEVSFTDNDNYSEGPLVSEAYPSTGTVKVPDNTAPTVTSIERQDPMALLD